MVIRGGGSSSCRELMKGESDTSAFAPLACSRWRITDCAHGASSSHDPHMSMKAATRYRNMGESCLATPLSQFAQPAQLGQPHLVLHDASGAVLQPPSQLPCSSTYLVMRARASAVTSTNAARPLAPFAMPCGTAAGAKMQEPSSDSAVLS